MGSRGRTSGRLPGVPEDRGLLAGGHGRAGRPGKVARERRSRKTFAVWATSVTPGHQDTFTQGRPDIGSVGTPSQGVFW